MMMKIIISAMFIMVLIVLFVGCAAAQQDFYIQSEPNPSFLYDTIEPPLKNPSSVLEEDYLHISSDGIQCKAELLYLAFLESDYWLRVRCLQCCGELEPILNCGRWRITDKNIFDFDGDGVLDLWFRAVGGERDFISPRWSSSITGFATIKDDEVVLLLSGYTTGGSIGGDFVAFGYDQETLEYVIILNGFAGGFGGNSSSSRIYSMRNGELTKLYWISHIYFWASHHNGEEKHIFRVNGEDVCYEVYAQIVNRFIHVSMPIDGDCNEDITFPTPTTAPH